MSFCEMLEDHIHTRWYSQGDICHWIVTAESQQMFHNQLDARNLAQFHQHDAWTLEHLIATTYMIEINNKMTFVMSQESLTHNY